MNLYRVTFRGHTGKNGKPSYSLLYGLAPNMHELFKYDSQEEQDACADSIVAVELLASDHDMSNFPLRDVRDYNKDKEKAEATKETQETVQ